MQINFVYDASVAGAPSAFKSALIAAAAYLDGLITNNITLNIQVGWGEDANIPIPSNAVATGGPAGAVTGATYAVLKSDLAKAATTTDDKTMLANLPANDPTSGGHFLISTAQQKAWGLISPDAAGIDGNIGFSDTTQFSYDPSNRAQAGDYDFISVAEHEITHAMGRWAGLQYAPGWYSPMDLVRYNGSQLQLAGGPADFSIDGGKTGLLPFDNNPVGDAGDWAESVRQDAFGYGTLDGIGAVSPTDIRLMDVLGFNVSGAASPPAANFTIVDNTNHTTVTTAGDAYTGSVSGLQYQCIDITPDSLNITSAAPNAFLRSGSGTDALNVSLANGDNILDGSTGSNFLTGGTGRDTFYLDDRDPASPIFSTIVNFHKGDDATVWGVNATDFKMLALDNQGAAGFTGLDLIFTAPGHTDTSFVLAGYTSADLTNGRLSQSYGTTPDLPNLPGSQYLTVHAN